MAEQTSTNPLFSLLTDAAKTAQTGFETYQTLSGSNKTTAPAAAAAKPATPAWQQYLPWIGGGLAVVVILVFVLKR